jgi:uncharacterized protein YjiS (DUF1127 family)
MIKNFYIKESTMLFVLEGARLLVNRTSGEWHLSPEYWSAKPELYRSARQGTSIGEWFGHIASAIRRSRERRQLIQELSAKSDRMLADAGIDRARIPEIANAAIGREQAHVSELVYDTPQTRTGLRNTKSAANDNRGRVKAQV